MKMILYSAILFLITKPVLAELTLEDFRRNAFGDIISLPGALHNRGGKLYDNDDGSQATIWTTINQGYIQYFVSKYDPIEQQTYDVDYAGSNWKFFGITINGEYPAGANQTSKRLDFDETGKLQARYNGQNLVETYKYTEDGQMLVYNPQGELIGAYNNFYDRHMSEFNKYDKAATLNHVDKNGNYTVKDGDKVLGIYKADGGVVEYKYDKGGNLISIYDNGVATYRRRIYTPAEATAAVSGKKNTFSIKYR